jgi:hypothetical protein
MQNITLELDNVYMLRELLVLTITNNYQGKPKYLKIYGEVAILISAAGV